MFAVVQEHDLAPMVRDAIAKAIENNRTYARAHPSSLEDAKEAQQAVKKSLHGLLKNDVDVIVTPGAPGVAPTVAEAAEAHEDLLFGIDSLNVQATLAGVPAITVPVGLSEKEGLPLAVQLMARPFEEARLLAVAHLLELAAKANRDTADGMQPLVQE